MPTDPAADPTAPAEADLLVIAGRAVLPGGEQPAVIVVRDGVIDDVLDPAAPRPAAREVLELAADEVLLPALVDTHVHGNDPGRTAWEGLATLTASAAAGGIGTLVDMPLNCVPATTSPAAMAAKQAACPVPSVDIGMWGGAVPEALDGLEELAHAGILGAKAFMLHSGIDEFGALSSDADLERAMEILAAADLPLLVHAEDAEEAAAAPQPPAGTLRYADLLAARPPSCEVRAIERLAALAARTGAHVHVVHVTAAEAIDVIARAQADGTRLTAETCPHYLALCAEDLPDGDPAVKCFPPIRERTHQDALWAALQAGTLSLVASDHSPSSWELKDTGDLATSWGGIASLQLALPVVWTQARRRGIPLATLAQWMAAAPAELAGLPQKGRIATGCDADLTILAPEATFTVVGAQLHHRHPQTPYEGHELQGVVRRTIVRGRTADPDGPPHGEWLLRRPDGTTGPAARATPFTTASTATTAPETTT